MTGFYQSAPLRGFHLSDLLMTRQRILANIAYYESGRRPIYPYYVARGCVPIILDGLRRQAAEIAAELERRGLVDDTQEDPKA